ncbi:MAG: hypothetical protein KatS3mg009_2988 [Acidimicrobiia bacterium]|nr:MAG: hypothetical protein KatS3mg009_2988 [Acidimicrobiia bacterium]
MIDDASKLRLRTRRLFDYLQEVRSLRERPIRDIAEYNDRLWWAGDLPSHKACRVSPDGTEPWLTVSKATVPPQPPLPSELIEFVEGPISDPAREPRLVEDLAERLEEDADRWITLGLAFENYLTEQWRPWALEAGIALKARKLYEDLYDLRLRLQREEAYIELVWGHGVLGWKVNGERVQHPLLTTRVQVDFDTETGDIRVVPADLSAHLEIELLQGLGLPGFDLLVGIRDRFRQEPVGPFDPETGNLYEQLLNSLGLDRELRDDKRPPEPIEAPVITRTWALFVRRRSTLYQRFFASLRDALADDDFPVPAPLGAIVAEEPSRLDDEASEDPSWRASGERLMMPLPTNPEQEQIALRLAENRGVTVQGPPGTGKTHTIANLICHLVAHGKRVLVTSQKEQALSVLRDKLPDDIRPLCVSVLGASSASLAELDQSVQAIYERALGLDNAQAQREIQNYVTELDQAQREVAELRNRIRRSIERERDTYRLGDEPHTPSTLARYLARTESRLAFIPDALDADDPCPLSEAELAELYQLAAALEPHDCDAARMRLPELDGLPSGPELSSLAADVSEIKDRLADAEDRITDLKAIDTLGAELLGELRKDVELAAERITDLERPWVASVRDELVANPGFAVTWQEHVKACEQDIEQITAWKRRVAGHDVRLPMDGLPTNELMDQLTELRDRLASGKGVSRFRTKKLHQLRRSCTVNGEELRISTDVELCVTEARLRRQRYHMLRRWNDEVGRVGGPTVETNQDHPEIAISRYLQTLASALDWEQEAWPQLRDRLRTAGFRVGDRTNAAELKALAATLHDAALRFRQREIEAEFARHREWLTRGSAAPEASPLWAQLAEAFDEQRWATWDELRRETDRLVRLAPRVKRLDELVDRLRAVAPSWASRILANRGDPETAGPPELATDAWRWRQADTWLSKVTGEAEPSELQRQLELKINRVATLTADLASALAWRRLSENLTDPQRQALTAWVQSLKKVGKGTGKYAAKHRADAHRAMRKAQEAVPVWVMPMHRVVESFDPAATKFDVVIVDESSQCDIFSLAALAVARKAVVVGDDKQISPQQVGIDQAAVHDLIAQHLSEIPHSDLLDITSSLYDIAKRTFPGVIMLKEHFRCLPEIIEFSNQLAYNGEILPLREEANDPLWTPVLDVHVVDGYRELANDTNPPEAKFIVEKISELCGDPRYDGKTFGVISLLGDNQAHLIEQMLIDALDEREIERRQLRCGNAYHFQGDERDVMFISLVVAAGDGRRIGAMTKEADRQRINVAASRAREQMWCVRSVGAEDLHPDDVRARFVRYCQNPGRVTETVTELAERCDSDFERDVLRELVSRGYNVKVQHKVGRYRIDMVVEHQGRRLAVECDGDAFHGPDRWEADRVRQAVLERLGWKFFRIRGSAFYRNPELALAALWERLEALSIRPGRDDGAQARQTSAAVAVTGAHEPGGPHASDVHDRGGADLGTTTLSASPPAMGDQHQPVVDGEARGNHALGSAASGAPVPRAPELPGAMHTTRDCHTTPAAAPEPPNRTVVRTEGGTRELASRLGPLAQLKRFALGFDTPTGPAEPPRSEAREGEDRRRPVVHQQPKMPVSARLAPYVAWTAHPLPDPNSASQKELIAGLAEIVAVEGPIVARRAYELYVRAAGGQRVGKRIRSTLNRAAAAAVRTGRLAQIRDAQPGQQAKTLYVPGGPDVCVRERGPRELEDIPPTEVAALARVLIDEEPTISDEALKRRLLELYERIRLTANASAYLDGCIKLARR